VLSYGERSALVGSEGATYWVSRERGAIGPLAIPADSRWVGLGQSDRILYADRLGTLFQSNGDKLDFAPVGKVVGAESWDSAGAFVVAGSTWDEVFLSKDGGKTFAKRSLGPGLRVEDVLVRSDGAVLAQARKVTDTRFESDVTTFLAMPGRPFAKSAIQADEFYKIGAWLWTDADCPAVLSKDGTHFVRAPAYAVDEQDHWADAMAPTDHGKADALSRADLVTNKQPPPPAYQARADAGRGAPCPESPSAPPDDKPPREKPACEAAACLADVMPAVGLRPSALSILADGLCAKLPCAYAQPFSRQPHAVRRDALAVIDLPKSCGFPFFLKNAPGLPLLFCSTPDEVTQVFALDREDRWHEEARFEIPADQVGTLSANEDGTVVFPSGFQRIFLRRPLAAGDKDAWREVKGERVAVRALSGGRLFIAAEETLNWGQGDKQKTMLTIRIDDQTIATVAKPEDLVAIGVRDGAIVFQKGEEARTEGVLLDNGTVSWNR
jgi:hypothetical protein